MASNGYINVEFLETDENSFYFGDLKVVHPDLEEDAFVMSNENHWTIESCHMDGAGYLILNQEDTFALQTCCENKLCIRTYLSSSLDDQEKLPVMIYAQRNNQTIVVCYKENQIQSVPMTLPTDIPGMNHEALFFQTRLDGTNRFKFVFSVDTNKVLGVVSTTAEKGYYKLALLPAKKDHVDERTMFVLHK